MSLAHFARVASVAAALLIAPGMRTAGAGEASSPTAPRGAQEESTVDVRQRLEVQRLQLAEAYEASDGAAHSELQARAAAAFTAALTDEILPRWLGVPWQKGEPSRRTSGVNCGSFVIAALEDAGLRFAHRAELARAPALRILESVAPEANDSSRDSSGDTGGIEDADRGIAKWQGTIPALERELVRRGPGVYLLGLARHIGFAVVTRDADGRGTVRLVHASRTAGQVVDEPMASSSALLRSRGAPIFAVRLGSDELIRRWLAGAALGPR